MAYIFFLFYTSWDTRRCPSDTHRRSHRTGCKDPDPTNFWESNMDPRMFLVSPGAYVSDFYFLFAR